MNRYQYFLKRLLLVIPTFIGITIACFSLTQFVPGGPIDQYMARMQGAQGEMASESTVSEEQKEALRKEFGFDKPIVVQYWDWLWHDRMGMMRNSYKYTNKKAWELIVERFPVSLIFGVTGFVITYLVCIPLGIFKAIKDGSFLDISSSIIVFIGYSIPAFAFGMLLKMLLSGTQDWGWDWFPLSGFRSDHYMDLTPWGQVKDVIHHMFLPVLCYMIGNFALLTILMKNSLLEEINKDYVRTVLARGGSVQRAIWGHALRNSLIPIATGFGGILTLMFAGNVLIEKVFEIPGMGRLSLEAIVSRDYAVFMALISVTSVLALLCNILTDFLYVIIDPRINFKKS